MKDSPTLTNAEAVREKVRTGYSQIAQEGSERRGGGKGCCGASLDGMVDWQDPLYQKIIAHLPVGTKPSDYITSLEITARKAESSSAGPSQVVSSKATAKVEVFDPAMCCSTGVCGPSVDPKLVQFAADLDWLKSQGVPVERYNLAQTPAAFAANATVKSTLEKHGTDCLPLVIVDGTIASVGGYGTKGLPES